MASFSSYAFSFILIFFFLLGSMMVSAELSSHYYDNSCPQASSIIQREVCKAIDNDTRIGASLLRLHFHDCFVNGCDASVLLDDIGDFIGEKMAGPNLNSLRGFEVIDTIKSALEGECRGKVSCADILALAARDSVVKLGGTSWIVPLGRNDSKTAYYTAANTDLPSPFSNLSTIISSFANKGFTTKEMVILSGAHTIGEARCVSFRTRIYNETNIDSTYADSLKVNCLSVGGDDNLAPLDTTTKKIFDNAYFMNLKKYKGLMHSDQELYDGGSTESIVDFYSTRNLNFLSDFGDAMIKMGNLSPPSGSEGEIRTNCRKRN